MSLSKKIHTLIFLHLLVASPLLSQGMSTQNFPPQGFCFKENETSLYLLTGNDKFSYGLSQNLDDQRTFSFGLHSSFKYFFVNADIAAITNRGIAVNNDQNNFVCGRYDLGSLVGGTDLQLFGNGFSAINIKPGLGILCAGNLGMEMIQNLNHSTSNVPELYLPYESFSPCVMPVANICADYTLYLARKIKASLFLKSTNSIFYNSNQDLGVTFTFGRDKTLIKYSMYYRFSQNYTDSLSCRLLSDVEKGVNFDIEIDSGFFNIEYCFRPDCRNGYENIGINLFSFKRKQWEESNFLFSTGISYYLQTEFMENQMEYCIKPWMSVYYANRYVSGYKKSAYYDLTQFRMERDYVLNSAGVKFFLPEWLRDVVWFTPYLEIGLGNCYFGLRELKGTSGINDIGGNSFFEIESTLGITLLPQDALIFGSSSFCVSAFAGTVIVPQHQDATKLINQDLYRDPQWRMELFQFRFGFVVSLGFDI